MSEAGGSATGPGAAGADVGFMRQALALAEAGWGRVHPNPLVGAVVVRDGAVVGTGAHREYGGPHAEVEALRAAGEAARGATLYVTLEPCAHFGKTPPCTDAILEAGIARVVLAVEDPHPEAAGGATRLEAAGVAVTRGVERESARAQNALFLRPTETGRPFVALKYGLSLDARIARRAGEATRVTGSEAEAEVHRLRAGFDAVLVGAETARVDDPRLTVRRAEPPRVPPVRVVADPRLTLSPDGRLARSAGGEGGGSEAGGGPVWVLVAEGAAESGAAAGRARALRARGVELVEVPAGPDGLDLAAALDGLWERGVRTVLCEGGGRLGAALLAASRVDRLYLFTAPRVFGSEGVAAFPGTAALEGRVVRVGRFGEDTLTVVDRSG